MNKLIEGLLQLWFKSMLGRFIERLGLFIGVTIWIPAFAGMTVKLNI